MRNNPFSVAIDGSGDTGIEKMNPPTVCLFDGNDGVVSTQFLDRCMSSSSTAEGIFAKMQEVLSQPMVSPGATALGLVLTTLQSTWDAGTPSKPGYCKKILQRM